MRYPKALLPTVEGISTHLKDSSSELSVYVYESLDSTNLQARRLLSEGLTRPCLLVAHTQTAGKGRMGRSFYSPAGNGLYMTLVYTLKGAAAEAVRATSAAAVAVCEAIFDICGKEAGIKWVNDLYLNGKKICGILTEGVPLGGDYGVILGIGINITTDTFPDGMRHPAGALLSAEDALVDQSLLCAAIVERLLVYLDPQNAARCLEMYRARLLLRGQRVICSRNFAADGTPDPTVATEGVVEGVDEDYGLILRLDDGKQTVLYGGEISLWIK